jgi:hypothetical protein
MGACTYSVTIEAQNDVEAKEKFWKLVQQCRYDFGHAGYTGTFAEKTAVKIIPIPIDQDYLTKTQIEEHPDGQDKWGPAVGGMIGPAEYYIFGWCSE